MNMKKRIEVLRYPSMDFAFDLVNFKRLKSQLGFKSEQVYSTLSPCAFLRNGTAPISISVVHRWLLIEHCGLGISRA